MNLAATTLAALPLALLGAACASPLGRYSSDAGTAGELLSERGAPVPVLRTADDGALVPEALLLVEDGLGEEEAVLVALLNNRAVRAAFAELGVSAAQAAQFALAANPAFEADAKFFSGGTEIELSLVQPILDLMLAPLRREVADAEYEAAKARVAGELVALVHEVRRAFVRVRATERLAAVRGAALEAAEAARDLMAELHRAGNVTDPALSAEEVALGRARIELAAAEAELSDAREPLNVLLGLWGAATAWRVEGALDEEPLAELDLELVESRAIAASLALAENRARAEAHARAAGLVSWEALLPGAGLGVAGKREASDGSFGLGPAVALDIPLFDRGGARRHAQRAQLERALASHVSLAVEVRSAARRLRERCVALDERARYLREVQLPAHELHVRHVLREYNAMQIGAFDVLAVRQLEIAAAREYVETLRDAWLARIDLEELLQGHLNRERLAAAPAAHAGAARSATKRGH